MRHATHLATGVGIVAPHPPRPAGEIGPNAITQTVASLRAMVGDDEAATTLRAATGRSLDNMPAAMVHESEANALMSMIRQRYEPAIASRLLRDAGERTAQYLLAHRIPPVVQALLRLLPAPLSLRLLLWAIARHAWTFAGSGQFTYIIGEPTTLRFANCALCRGHASFAPICEYYAATFERLFRQVVHRSTLVHEVECCAAGGSVCRFVLSLP
jgi:divinyl protochlorophyllide a 8-vinyl-reductase